MAALPPPAVPVRGRRGALGSGGAGEPECKRLCTLRDPSPREPGAQLMDWAMDLDSRQKFLPDSAPWAAKTKQNSMILENHGSKGTSQPCPRCVAGESIVELKWKMLCSNQVFQFVLDFKYVSAWFSLWSLQGHFSHILGF